jgi:hypothetical protein
MRLLLLGRFPGLGLFAILENQKHATRRPLADLETVSSDLLLGALIAEIVPIGLESLCP